MTNKERISAPEDHIGYWLRYVSNNVAHAFSRTLQMSAVTVAEWIVLREIYKTGKTSPGAVAQNLGLTKGAVSKLIDRLLRKNLVVREESTKDRRFREIKLTNQGKRLVPRLARIADKNDDYFFGDLPAGKKKGLINFLKGIVETHHLGRNLVIENGRKN